jgi:hypothetical protein
MQIVTQTAAGPARLGAAASTVSLARTLGSSLGASAFGALIYGLIGASPALARPRGLAVDPGIEHAFDAAFAAAAALCLLAAWSASRVPPLRFDAEQPVTAPAGD